MRIVVLGGYGNFGTRICRALATDASMTILAAGRHAGAAPIDFAARGIQSVTLDLAARDFASSFAALKPALVVHCVGPFQGQDYRVAHAALACGAHYIDLSDGRDFVAGFAEALDEPARRVGRLAITGASTLPALSSVVVDDLLPRFSSLKSIETVIAPAQRAPRGAATLAGVMGYAGKSFQVWERGAWRAAFGWQEIRRMDLGPLGKRLSALCDVPDLALFPQRYVGVANVVFRAALEVGVQHIAIAMMAILRRAGVEAPIPRLAARLDALAAWFNIFGSETGGMTVTVDGLSQSGAALKLRWHVVAPGNRGPEIPCMAAILLARKLASGTLDEIGAMPCMGLVTLAEFAPEFAQRGMQTGIEELPQ